VLEVGAEYTVTAKTMEIKSRTEMIRINPSVVYLQLPHFFLAIVFR
jgi:hypothetical protein